MLGLTRDRAIRDVVACEHKRSFPPEAEERQLAHSIQAVMILLIVVHMHCSLDSSQTGTPITRKMEL